MLLAAHVMQNYISKVIVVCFKFQMYYCGCFFLVSLYTGAKEFTLGNQEDHSIFSSGSFMREAWPRSFQCQNMKYVDSTILRKCYLWQHSFPSKSCAREAV